jgi:hypothetical protein
MVQRYKKNEYKDAKDAKNVYLCTQKAEKT